MTEQQQRDLAGGLRALADSTRDMQASPRIEVAILREMGGLMPASTDAAAPAPTGSRLSATSPWRWASAGPRRVLPLAAALILAVGAALWTARSPVRPAVRPSGFVALPGAAWLPEMESATIVRVSLPVTALPAYGVAIQPDVTSDAVLAELLVAQDGQARAIRFVNDSD